MTLGRVDLGRLGRSISACCALDLDTAEGWILAGYFLAGSISSKWHGAGLHRAVYPLAVRADPLNALEGLGIGLCAKEFLHMLMEWPGRFESEVGVILPSLAIIGS